MKNLLISLVLLPLISFSQWPCSDISLGTLQAEVQGDTVVLKNNTAYRNCGALYSMEVSQSNDTIIWLQRDIGDLAICYCFFDLSVTLDSLRTGHYYVKAYFKAIEGDTTCFIGLIEFDIIKQNNYLSHNIIEEGQSDCSQVGIGEVKIDDNQDLMIYPNPAKDILTISCKKGTTIEEVVIYNQMGQKVFEGGLLNNTIDVSGLRHGLYVVEVVGEDWKVWRKLIVE